MEKYIGLIAGSSGEAITKEIHKIGMKVVLVAGKKGESGTNIADIVLCVDLTEKETIKFLEIQLRSVELLSHLMEYNV